MIDGLYVFWRLWGYRVFGKYAFFSGILNGTVLFRGQMA